MRPMKRITILVFLLSYGILGNAQKIDILIKGGRVIDPKNNVDAIIDVAILDGKIQRIAENISAENATSVVDATGLLVCPGLIDIHGHHFWGTQEDAYLANSFSSLPPDGFTLRVGVTTVVDAGGAGWRNFRKFKEQTIDKSITRVLAFINIVGSGMAGGAIEQNLGDMDAKLTAMAAQKYKDHIVGVKLAHYYGPEWLPAERAVAAGEEAGIPVMVDFGGFEEPLSTQTLFMEKLRPGDIFTHCYAHVVGREAVVDENGKLRPFILDAQERGIIFDVGHGGGSFLFKQAIPAIEQGMKPNTISTDLHTGSMNAGMKDMLNVMSKFLNMGLPVEEVIEKSTWKPAQVIQRPELGNLDIGAIADISILSLEEGEFGFVDVRGWRLEGTQKLLCELTIKDGKVVYDLNGLSRPSWSGK